MWRASAIGNFSGTVNDFQVSAKGEGTVKVRSGAQQARKAGRWAAVCVAMAFIAGCGSDSSSSNASLAPTADASTTTSAAEVTTTTMDSAMSMKTTYPVTIEDCDGRKTTYQEAPERVVTIDPSVTEMLLTLGLKDRIVGFTQFFPPEQEWAPVKGDMDSLKVINDPAVGYPSKEAVVAENPDLVTSVYSYAFLDPLPDRDGWTALGVNSYQTLGECSATPSDDFSLMYQDIRNFGIMFDVQDRAEAVIADLESRVAAVQQRVKDEGLPSYRIATHGGGTEHPDWYGGSTITVIALAGSTYIWADLGLDGQATWEQFVARNPEVIWVIPDAGSEVAALEQQLENDPRLTEVAGVKNKAYVVVPQADATVESPRLVDGLEKLVDELIALK